MVHSQRVKLKNVEENSCIVFIIFELENRFLNTNTASNNLILPYKTLMQMLKSYKKQKWLSKQQMNTVFF